MMEEIRIPRVLPKGINSIRELTLNLAPMHKVKPLKFYLDPLWLPKPQKVLEIVHPVTQILLTWIPHEMWVATSSEGGLKVISKNILRWLNLSVRPTCIWGINSITFDPLLVLFM